MHREPNEEKHLAFKDLPAKVGVIGIQDKCVENKESQATVRTMQQNKAEQSTRWWGHLSTLNSQHRPQIVG